MSPSKACPRCGRIVHDGDRYCPEHKRDPKAHWSKNRDRAEQKRFRKAVIAQYAGQCAAMVNGVRCHRRVETHALEAHHFPDGSGILLCQSHHAAVDPHARITRSDNAA